MSKHGLSKSAIATHLEELYEYANDATVDAVENEDQVPATVIANLAHITASLQVIFNSI